MFTACRSRSAKRNVLTLTILTIVLTGPDNRITKYGQDLLARDTLYNCLNHSDCYRRLHLLSLIVVLNEPRNDYKIRLNKGMLIIARPLVSIKYPIRNYSNQMSSLPFNSM